MTKNLPVKDPHYSASLNNRHGRKHEYSYIWLM